MSFEGCVSFPLYRKVHCFPPSWVGWHISSSPSSILLFVIIFLLISILPLYFVLEPVYWIYKDKTNFRFSYLLVWILQGIFTGFVVAIYLSADVLLSVVIGLVASVILGFTSIRLTMDARKGKLSLREEDGKPVQDGKLVLWAMHWMFLPLLFLLPFGIFFIVVYILHES